MVSEVGPGACVGFLVGATGACALVSGAQSFPLMGRAMSGGVFWDVCELSMTLSSLLLVAESVFLSCWLCGVRFSALELAGRWVELGLGDEMDTSWRMHAN